MRCRLAHYVIAADQPPSLALVINHRSGEPVADLLVYPAGTLHPPTESPILPPGGIWMRAIAYHADHLPGTWHWIDPT